MGSLSFGGFLDKCRVAVASLSDEYTFSAGHCITECHDKEGNEAGYLLYTFEAEHGALKIGNIFVRDHPLVEALGLEDWFTSGHQGKGVGAALLAYAILQHGNAVKTIEGTYSYSSTNMQEYRESISDGDDVINAIMDTPGYKIRKELGFDKVVDYEVGEMHLYIKMSR